MQTSRAGGLEISEIKQGSRGGNKKCKVRQKEGIVEISVASIKI